MDNLVKLNIVTHGKFDNELLGGIAVGLLSQIYDAGGKDYLTPEMHFCAVSVKDKSTPTNFHTDNWGEGRLKVLGLLNSDWNSKEDGGGFICDDVPYILEPTDFLIFDSNQTHSNDIITSNKRNLWLLIPINHYTVSYIRGLTIITNVNIIHIWI